jgi:spore coat polysaccharide biosynthesis predicted glycosyltransferase SpsG
MPVIIAPHPRTKDSSNLINLYNNRKVSNCSTAELVRGCNIVMSHVSTSINFAVLWKKPLLILSTNEIERSLYFAIESICRLLEVNRINVDKYDKGVNLLQHANLPIKNYSKYKKYLIKTESSPDEKSSDILIKGLEKYVQ